jgi:hypothetical protein
VAGDLAKIDERVFGGMVDGNVKTGYQAGIAAFDKCTPGADSTLVAESWLKTVATGFPC